MGLFLNSFVQILISYSQDNFSMIWTFYFFHNLTPCICLWKQMLWNLKLWSNLKFFKQVWVLGANPQTTSPPKPTPTAAFHTTTPRPTREQAEFAYTFFYYDSHSVSICSVTFKFRKKYSRLRTMKMFKWWKWLSNSLENYTLDYFSTCKIC